MAFCLAVRWPHSQDLIRKWGNGESAENGEPARPCKALIAVLGVGIALGTACFVLSGLRAIARVGVDHGVGAGPSVTTALGQAFVEEFHSGEIGNHLEREGVKSAKDPKVQVLAKRGYIHLSQDDQETKARIQVRFMDVVGTADCARMARGGLRSEEVESFISRLSRKDVYALARIMARSIVAEATASPAMKTLAATERQQLVTAYLAQVQAALPQPEATRLIETLRNYKTASDEDVCWANRQFYLHALGLPPGEGRKRALLLLNLLESGR